MVDELIFKYFVTQNVVSSNNTHIDIGKLLLIV